MPWALAPLVHRTNLCRLLFAQSQKVRFPLPHRVIKTPKVYKTTFKASTAKTFFG